MPTKIATCCYCGTRAILTLAGETRHELACARCGAPISALKRLPAANVRPETSPAPQPRAVAEPAQATDVKAKKKPMKRKKPGRSKRKGLRLGKVLEEAWDVIEDIFD